MSGTLTFPVLQTIQHYDAAIAKTERLLREWKRRRKTIIQRELSKKQFQDPAWKAHFRAQRAAARNDPEKVAHHVGAARKAALEHWDKRGRLPKMTPQEYYRYRKLKSKIGKVSALAQLFPSSAQQTPLCSVRSIPSGPASQSTSLRAETR